MHVLSAKYVLLIKVYSVKYQLYISLSPPLNFDTIQLVYQSQPEGEDRLLFIY